MHGHDLIPPEVHGFLDTFGPIGAAVAVGHVLFVLGLLPIPIGYERGKVKFLVWCGTGMHAHAVYWWGGEDGFQTLHPADQTEVGVR